jgi:uncharacterized protein (UPF0332 family)
VPEQGGIRDLAQYRLEQAEQCLRAAKLLVEAEDYKAAANRSYYCIFHCMRAVLATERFDSKKHAGIIATFRKDFIKTGVFPVKYSGMIGAAFDLRGASDYDDFYVVAKQDVAEQISQAEEFLLAVREFLKKSDTIL